MRVPYLIGACAVACFALAAPAAGQGFGSGIAVTPDEVLIGERGGSTSTGAVYVYHRGSDGWRETDRLLGSDVEAGGGFGSVLSRDGDRLLVTSGSAAHIFEKTGGSWTETARVSLDRPIGFGAEALLYGDAAFVFPGSGFRARDEPGSVLVLERTADGTWHQAATLQAEDGSPGDRFGSALTAHTDVLGVGAPGARVDDLDGAGVVYGFEKEAGAWRQIQRVSHPDPEAGAGFGSSLLSREWEGGMSVYVAAPGQGLAGTVYEFPLVVPELTLGAVFSPPVVEGSRPRFGTSLATVGDELWIGGVVDGEREGRVFRYARTDGGWTFAGTLAGEGLGRNSGFGSRIAAAGEIAVVAAGGKDYGWGTAYLFARSPSGWTQVDEVWSEVEGYAAISGGEIACEDGTAADFGCGEVDIKSFVPVEDLGAGRGVRVNDVWGWTDSQTGREYALVGLTDQASFVDITDAENPRYLGRLPMPRGANGSTWRDIKVYRDHAFIVSDGAGPHGMQVFDLTRLRDVGAEPVTFDMDAHYEGIASAHNIVINEATGFAYSVGSSGGGETCGGGLHMIDIREPTQPKFAGCFADTNTGRRKTGYSHDAMCIEYHGPDTEHVGKEICFGSNETALSIADVTNKDDPVALSFAAYPDVGYAHQGWITEDHRYFYMDDELDEIADARREDGGRFTGTRTMIWDVSDLDDPVLVKEHFGETLTSDHNLYIKGDLMYQSNYNSGLRILDVSDPENPREVGYLDTVPYAEGPSMGGSWSNFPYFASGHVIVTSGSEGLFVVRHRRAELVP